MYLFYLLVIIIAIIIVFLLPILAVIAKYEYRMKSFTTTASAAVSRIDTDKPENIPSLTHRYLTGSLTYNAQDLPIIEIRNVLITWYSKNRRKLPWRGDLDNECSNNELLLETIVQKQDRKSRVSAYGTWVSEIMCQQTKVETVINYWKRWMTVKIAHTCIMHISR